MKGYAGSKTKEAIRDLWMTPDFVFDFYNKRFRFTTDVAASFDNRKCKDHRSEKFDGLLTGWGEMNWCNNPYSNTSRWVEKAISESVKGRATVMLIPADTSVKWFKKAFEHCSECHFISGRLSFINEETKKPVSGNNKGSVVFVFDSKSPVKQYVTLIDRDSMK
ncbi:DNA N-6-adenine-methyltransferase [Vibrio phage 1.029.O._10N.261.55.A7]|nr:DNA N-6-adenine-methyltransferase [Vibrio phage 1.029.O._10N.261.55.A7]